SLYSQRPRRYVYELTESGRELAVILPALRNWASRHDGGDTAPHLACGTPLETRLWCPSCEVVVDAEQDPEQDPGLGAPHGHDAGVDELRWV
ncbi:MAG TPA: winged helix-turn-helix transcriptional regulator, partial [Ilumatobacter sp.]|nr:winged helix-turn-helix transcriptional regulator [Ilumatobacter sp.]